MIANIYQINAHNGPYFRRWRERMAASVGAVLVDEQRDTR